MFFFFISFHVYQARPLTAWVQRYKDTDKKSVCSENFLEILLYYEKKKIKTKHAWSKTELNENLL